MPTINCEACGAIKRIPTKKWKLIISGEPYICSADCLVNWLERIAKIDPHLIVPDGMVWNTEFGAFRSQFEERVQKFLHSKEIPTVYEAATFRLDHGSYTPDFYLPDHACFLETKGLWQIGQRKKFKRFREQFPGVPLVIVPWTIQDQF